MAWIKAEVDQIAATARDANLDETGMVTIAVGGGLTMAAALLKMSVAAGMSKEELLVMADALTKFRDELWME